jgi:L-ectoine synthase
VIIRSADEMNQTNRRIVTKQWESLRLLLKDDNMGFSFHITTVYAGEKLAMHYLNHLESVYCVSGMGEIQTVDDGKTFSIKPGIIYALDKHDKHILHARTELKLACVFNPPLNGREVHDDEGSYPLTAETVNG